MRKLPKEIEDWQGQVSCLAPTTIIALRRADTGRKQFCQDDLLSIGNLQDTFNRDSSRFEVGKVSLSLNNSLGTYNQDIQDSILFNLTDNQNLEIMIYQKFEVNQLKLFYGVLDDFEFSEDIGKSELGLNFIGHLIVLEKKNGDDILDPNTGNPYEWIYFTDLVNLILDEGGVGLDKRVIIDPKIEKDEHFWDYFFPPKKYRDGKTAYDAGDRATAICHYGGIIYLGIGNFVYSFNPLTRAFMRVFEVMPSSGHEGMYGIDSWEEDTIVYLNCDGTKIYGAIANRATDIRFHKGNVHSLFEFELTSGAKKVSTSDLHINHCRGRKIKSKLIDADVPNFDVVETKEVLWQSVGFTNPPLDKDTAHFGAHPSVVASDGAPTWPSWTILVYGEEYGYYIKLKKNIVYGTGERDYFLVGDHIAWIVTDENDIDYYVDLGYILSINDDDDESEWNIYYSRRPLVLPEGMPGMYDHGQVICTINIPDFSPNPLNLEPGKGTVEFDNNSYEKRGSVDIDYKWLAEGMGNNYMKAPVGSLNEGGDVDLQCGFLSGRGAFDIGSDDDGTEWKGNYYFCPFWLCLPAKNREQYYIDANHKIFLRNEYQQCTADSYSYHGDHGHFDTDPLDNYLRIDDNDSVIKILGRAYFTIVGNILYLAVNGIKVNETYTLMDFKLRAYLLRIDINDPQKQGLLWQDKEAKYIHKAEPVIVGNDIYLSLMPVEYRKTYLDAQIIDAVYAQTSIDTPAGYEADDRCMAKVFIRGDFTDRIQAGDIIFLANDDFENDPDCSSWNGKAYRVSQSTAKELRDYTTTLLGPIVREQGTELFLLDAGPYIPCGKLTKWRQDNPPPDFQDYPTYPNPLAYWMAVEEFMIMTENAKTKLRDAIANELSGKYMWIARGYEPKETGLYKLILAHTEDNLAPVYINRGFVGEIEEGHEYDEGTLGEQGEVKDTAYLLPGFELSNSNVIQDTIKVFYENSEFEFEVILLDELPKAEPDSPNQCYAVNYLGSDYDKNFILFSNKYNGKVFKTKYEYYDNDIFTSHITNFDDKIHFIENKTGKFFRVDEDGVTLISLLHNGDTGVSHLINTGTELFALADKSNLLCRYSKIGTGYIPLADLKGKGLYSALGLLALNFFMILREDADGKVYITPRGETGTEKKLGIENIAKGDILSITETTNKNNSYETIEIQYRNGTVKNGNSQNALTISAPFLESRALAQWLLDKMLPLYSEYNKSYELEMNMHYDYELLDKINLDEDICKTNSTISEISSIARNIKDFTMILSLYSFADNSAQETQLEEVLT